MQRKIWPRSSPVILMYHRVAEPACDPWELAVSLDRFEQQMDVLRRVRKPLSMGRFVEGLLGGDLSERAVAVTFDDGYIDNLLNAKPILERHGIPATVFLATGEIGQQHEYWWDELARLILQSDEKVDGTISIRQKLVPVLLIARDASPAMCDLWRASDPPRSDREALYLSIWRQLRILKPADRIDVLRQLRIIFSACPPDRRDFPMTEDNVRALTDGGTFSVGSHTVSHPLLSSLHPEERAQEIQQSKTDCESLTGISIEGFAYPYGDCDSTTQRIVRDAGYRWACSTESGPVALTGFDLFKLPRVQVCNWNVVEFKKWFC
jgi:peptidoglycan/xylan/chitin deacetylase (PgdA/CDA1 family)